MTWRFTVEMPSSIGTPASTEALIKDILVEALGIDPRKVSVTFKAEIE